MRRRCLLAVWLRQWLPTCCRTSHARVALQNKSELPVRVGPSPGRILRSTHARPTCSQSSHASFSLALEQSLLLLRLGVCIPRCCCSATRPAFSACWSGSGHNGRDWRSGSFDLDHFGLLLVALAEIFDRFQVPTGPHHATGLPVPSRLRGVFLAPDQLTETCLLRLCEWT